MKKLTKILICLMLCVFGFGLVACGDPRTKEEKNFSYPSSADYTYGNGGLAVRKGNYVYFVNGYKSVKGLSNENKEDTYMVGSLMLMKLGANGEVVTDENGLLRDEYFITMSNKLCGYEATNLFIHGNYLYFATPCEENENGDEVWAKDRVIINRIELDKSSDVEEVYRSGVKVENLEYQYYVSGGKLFILAWEKGESVYEDYGTNALIKVDVATKNVSIVSNDVTEVLFAENSDEIFFTKHSDSDSYYYLKQLNIGGSLSTYNAFNKTFDILDVKDGNVFVSIAHDYGSSVDIMSSEIAKRSGFETLYEDVNSSTVVIADKGEVILIKDKTFTFGQEIETFTDDSATSINVIAFTNGCILYADGTSGEVNIKLISYSNAIAGNKVEAKTLTTISVGSEKDCNFDFSEDENMLYFFKNVGSSEYLHRIKVNFNVGETEEMFGVYLDQDVPEQVEEEEEEIEEEE